MDGCLVFGLPDERFGQRIVGVAALSGDAPVGADDILGQLRTKLSSYKVPRALAVVDEVPRAPDKADYPRARALFEASPAD